MSKLNNLVEWFTDKSKVMIALSGGVDSAVVAYAAFQALGSSAIAVTADYKTLSRRTSISKTSLFRNRHWANDFRL